MQDLTVIILTKNEEDNLKKCIASVKTIAKRIVVVDSFSEDHTVSLARKLGADVYENVWVDYATQFNWALDNTELNTTWALRLDADEELLPELIEELEQLLPRLDEGITGVELRRRMYFMGKWIRHGGIYPTMMLRLFRVGHCRCEQTIMDEHMYVIDGRVIQSKNDFIDYNTKPLEWWIGKHNWYSDREVVDYKDKERQLETGETLKPRFFGSQPERKRWLKYMMYYKTPLMRRAHWYFIYRYYIRLGFLDGKEGLAYHFLQGYWYRFLVDAKIYESGLDNDNLF